MTYLNTSSTTVTGLIFKYEQWNSCFGTSITLFTLSYDYTNRQLHVSLLAACVVICYSVFLDTITGVPNSEIFLSGLLPKGTVQHFWKNACLLNLIVVTTAYLSLPWTYIQCFCWLTGNFPVTTRLQGVAFLFDCCLLRYSGTI